MSPLWTYFMLQFSNLGGSPMMDRGHGMPGPDTKVSSCED